MLQFKTTITTFFICVLLAGSALAQQSDTTRAEADSSTVTMTSTGEKPANDVPDEGKDVHRQDSPEERGFLISSPDNQAELRIRGSVRVNGAYDFNGLQDQDLFSTFDIPTGVSNVDEPRFFMSANQSRIGIEATKVTKIGETFMRIETDFRGQTNSLRLRHAYGSLNHFLLGQTWSTFGDVASIPLTVDLDGPNSGVAERTVQIRYTKDVTEDFLWAVSAESPSPEFSVPDSLGLQPPFQSFPDLIGRFRKYGDWGHLQLAGVFRSIALRDTSTLLTYEVGYGGLLSGHMELTPSNEIFFQIVAGVGISRFITALTGRGLDVVYNPASGQFETLPVLGGFLSYGHTWRPHLNSYFTAGLTNIINKNFQPDDAFSFSSYISGNLFWDVASGMRVGIEYSWGRREDKNSASGTANRFSFIAYYDF